MLVLIIVDIGLQSISSGVRVDFAGQLPSLSLYRKRWNVSILKTICLFM